MPRRNGSRGSNRQAKQPDRLTARNNGVFAVRRTLAKESHETLADFTRDFSNLVHGNARVFELRSLSATVISLSRFSERQIKKGPSTKSIYDSVESHTDSLNARIGELALYGSNKKLLFALCLDSDDLIKEEAEFDRIYEMRTGGRLDKDINSEDGYSPHLSVALIYNDYVEYYQQDAVLAALNEKECLQSIVGEHIVLGPPPPFPDYSRHA